MAILLWSTYAGSFSNILLWRKKQTQSLSSDLSLLQNFCTSDAGKESAHVTRVRDLHKE